MLKKLDLTCSESTVQQMFADINKLAQFMQADPDQDSRIENSSMNFDESCSPDCLFLWLTGSCGNCFIDWEKISVTELLLRVGLEVFRVISKDGSPDLSISNVMTYNRRHLKDLDMDIVSVLELLEFYGSGSDSGVIQRKQSIVQFFSNSIQRLAKSIMSTKSIEDIIRTGFSSSSFKLQQAQDLQIQEASQKHQQHQQQRESGISQSQIYSEWRITLFNNEAKFNHNLAHPNSQQQQQQSNQFEREGLQGLLKKNFNLHFEVTEEEEDQVIYHANEHITEPANQIRFSTQQSASQIATEARNASKIGFEYREIDEYFQENGPKNKGWLFRSSKKHKNKWSKLFFTIIKQDSKPLLHSFRPTSVKKEMDCKDLELFKCSFNELLLTVNMGDRNTLKSRHTEGDEGVPGAGRTTVTTSKFGGKREGSEKQQQHQSQKQQLTMQMVSECFFVFDRVSKKHYLIRSSESVLVMSIISYFNNNLVLTDNSKNQFMHLLQEFAGIVEIALCNRSKVDKQHSDLSSFSFKKQFMSIKAGKCSIWNVKKKDILDISEFEIKAENIVPLASGSTSSIPKNSFAFKLTQKKPSSQNSGENCGLGDQLDLKDECENVNYDIEEENLNGLGGGCGGGGLSQQSSVVMFNAFQAGNSNNINVNSKPFHGTSQMEFSPAGGIDNALKTKQQQQQLQQITRTTTNSQGTTQKPAGFFSKIFSRIYTKQEPKLEQLLIAAESDAARKLWIFTLNYHRTMQLRCSIVPRNTVGSAALGSRIQMGTENRNNFASGISAQNSQNFFSSINQNNHYYYNTQQNYENKQVVSLQQQEQQGSQKNPNPLSNLFDNNENDYYDIFARQAEEIIDRVNETPATNSANFVENNVTTQPNVNAASTTTGGTTAGAHQTNKFIESANNAPSTQLFNSNLNRQSITRNTEEALYTMSFPVNSMLFKKSLLTPSDCQNFIPNSKEILSQSDEDLWTKFLKHFFKVTHANHSVDLYQLQRFYDQQTTQEQQQQYQFVDEINQSECKEHEAEDDCSSDFEEGEVGDVEEFASTEQNLPSLHFRATFVHKLD